MFLAYNNSINMTNISKNIKQRGITPIVTVIILIVISTILVLLILSFGREHTNKSLERTNDIDNFTVSDAESFIYPKEMQNGVLLFNYNPPADIEDKEITITGYKIANVSGMEPIQLETPFTFSANSQNVLVLDCLYEHSVKDKVDLKLITADYKYIDISVRDPDMVCSSGGTGTEEDPIVVCNADDLNAVRLNLDANYVLGKDIDLKCYSRREEEGWEPIGTDFENGFNGIFDGQNHTISNLYINTDNDNIGLFGFVAYNEGKTIEIKNLILKDVNITGNQNVGSIAANFAMYAIISNVHSSGTINGESYVGGLVGKNTYGGFNSIGGDLNFSSFTGQINSSGAYAGGLIGRNFGNIENSNSNIIINSNGDNVGGIVGDNKGIISKVHSKGSITSSGNNVGGTIGINGGKIYNSYSLCEVSGNDYVGGLVGMNKIGSGMVFPPTPSGYIYYSFSAGRVTGVSNVGGFVGGGNASDIYYSVYDTNTSEQSDTGKGAPKTTEEMKQQQTYVGWDFTNVWAIDPNKNNGYPYLIFNTGG